MKIQRRVANLHLLKTLSMRVADEYLMRTKVAKSPRKKWENPNNGRSKVVYVEAILDNPKQLLKWWEKNVKDYMGAGDPVPLLDTKVAHHMTIAYGGNNPGIPLAEVEQLGVGGKVQLEVIGYDYQKVSNPQTDTHISLLQLVMVGKPQIVMTYWQEETSKMFQVNSPCLLPLDTLAEESTTLRSIGRMSNVY